MNVSKDTYIDFRHKNSYPTKTNINEQDVAIVQQHSCLESIIDNKISYNFNSYSLTDILCKKGQQHLHCLMNVV